MVLLNDETLRPHLEKNPLTLVQFGAPWCAPCRAMKPLLDRLEEAHRGQVSVAYVDIDENPSAAHWFNIRAVPTVLVFQRGEPTGGLYQAVPYAMLEKFLQNYL